MRSNTICRSSWRSNTIATLSSNARVPASTASAASRGSRRRSSVVPSPLFTIAPLFTIIVTGICRRSAIGLVK